MGIRAFATLVFISPLAGAYAAQTSDVVFDIYYKERGDIVEQATATLAFGAISKVTLRSGTTVEVAAGAPGPDGNSTLRVDFGGPEVPNYPSRRVGDLRSDLSKPHRPSFVLQLPDKRDVTVIVRAADKQ